jgi:LysM repeat protein
MKKNITLFAFTLLSIISLNAQRELDSLNYENTQDISFFRNIKNNTDVKKYKTINKNVIQVGDTVILGNPTSQEFNSRTYSASYGNQARGGVSNSRSTSTKTYEFIQMGRPAGFGSILSAMNGEAQTMASNSLKNTKAIVKEIKAYHRGSKKKPLYLIMVLGEMNGKAFGINKYLSVMDTELAIESNEILLKNRKMTREEAISKLKEAKELMDIEMMSKEEFENLKKELGPIIRGN